jgi:hypothetical protein
LDQESDSSPPQNAGAKNWCRNNSSPLYTHLNTEKIYIFTSDTVTILTELSQLLIVCLRPINNVVQLMFAVCGGAGFATNSLLIPKLLLDQR